MESASVVSDTAKTLYLHGTQWNSHCYLGETVLDGFIKLENIQRDYNWVCDYIGIEPVELKKTNVRINKPHWKHWSYYYDKIALKIVEEIFDIDFEKFNYEKISNKNDYKPQT